MDLISALMETGLTRHEARLYVLLSSEGAISGYEAAKLTTMSRSNAYIALSGLTEKGGAMRIEGDVQRYEAVPIHEYVTNKRRHFDQVLQIAEREMPRSRASVEPYLTIRGRRHIIDKVRNMISQASERVYISLPAADLKVVLPELGSLRDRGGKVVVFASHAFNMTGAIVYHMPRNESQVRVIVDSSEILTGEIGTQSESTCLYSRHAALVNLFKDAMKNEIRLIEIRQDKS